MEKTNIRTAIMVVAIFVAVLALAAAVIMTPRASALTDGQDGRGTYKYVLRAHNGYVAVFSADDRENPYYISDMPVALLPEADRRDLEKGIAVRDEEELTHLLEDLTS